MNWKVYAKAIVAAIGAGVTAAAGLSGVQWWMTVAAAVLTAAVTWRVPNARPPAPVTVGPK